MVNKSFNFILWEWDKPLDLDFSQSIILFNGNNIANTSDNFFNALNLNENTEYTITVFTKDTSGNINSNGVMNTAKTDKKDNGAGKKIIKLKTIQEENQIIFTSTQMQNKTPISLDNLHFSATEKCRSPWTWFLIIIILIAVIILGILIYSLV